MDDKVLNFIYRRFPDGNKWKKENSFFFALILKKVFWGTIYFDTEKKWFITKVKDKYYCPYGVYLVNEDKLVSWQAMYEDDFENWRDVIKEYCK